MLSVQIYKYILKSPPDMLGIFLLLYVSCMTQLYRRVVLRKKSLSYQFPLPPHIRSTNWSIELHGVRVSQSQEVSYVLASFFNCANSTMLSCVGKFPLGGSQLSSELETQNNTPRRKYPYAPVLPLSGLAEVSTFQCDDCATAWSTGVERTQPPSPSASCAVAGTLDPFPGVQVTIS